ncbi:anti-lipopolysaccharide factor-like [Panulirus ornatus]|uniref:anti-lipopolysaccharide factor-like n=1 Tax=Panulirus ornatus TaxID=150431 RepID=UPI003A897A4D
MRQCVLMSVVFMAGALVIFAPQCQGFSLDSLLPVLTDQISGLWRDGEMELLGHYCNYAVKPTIIKFELYFQGSVWCPGWTKIRGEALTRSKTGVVGKTTSDFVKKIYEAGLVTEEEAREWVN